jgi:putative ABC transport system ATP-binding protein
LNLCNNVGLGLFVPVLREQFGTSRQRRTSEHPSPEPNRLPTSPGASFPILSVKQLTKTYKTGERLLTVVKEISFSISEGSTCSIVGPSGSGKTTLLGLCAGLDRPSSGTVILNGIDLSVLSEDNLAEMRNQHVGFVFQAFQLIPTLTALENVMVPLELRGEAQTGRRAVELLRQVGLEERLHHYPAQLSGGEQQRVALARAFINRPKLLFADEPTGNLDAETSQRIIHLLFELNEAFGTTLIVVTHDFELAGRTQRVLKLRGGLVVSDEIVENRVRAKKYE